MGIISIRNARDHKAALREIDKLLAVKKLTEEQNRRLDALTILVDAYEEKAFPMGGLDPVDLIKAHMSNSGRRIAWGRGEGTAARALALGTDDCRQTLKASDCKKIAHTQLGEPPEPCSNKPSRISTTCSGRRPAARLNSTIPSRPPGSYF